MPKDNEIILLGGAIGLAGLAYLFSQSSSSPIANTKSYQSAQLIQQYFKIKETELDNHVRAISAIIFDFDQRVTTILEELINNLPTVSYTLNKDNTTSSVDTEQNNYYITFSNDDAKCWVILQTLPVTNHIACKIILSSISRGYNETFYTSSYFNTPDEEVVPLNISATKAYLTAQNFITWWPMYDKTFTDLDAAVLEMSDKFYSFARTLANVSDIYFGEYTSTDPHDLGTVRNVRFLGDDAIAYLISQRYEDAKRIGVKIMVKSPSRNYDNTLFRSPYYNHTVPGKLITQTSAYLNADLTYRWINSKKPPSGSGYTNDSLVYYFGSIVSGEMVYSPINLTSEHYVKTFTDDDAKAELFINIGPSGTNINNPKYKIVVSSTSRPQSNDNPSVFDGGYTDDSSGIYSLSGTKIDSLVKKIKAKYNAGVFLPAKKFTEYLISSRYLPTSDGSYSLQSTNYGGIINVNYNDQSEGSIKISYFPPGIRCVCSLWNSNHSNILIRDEVLYESEFFDDIVRTISGNKGQKFLNYLVAMFDYEDIYKLMAADKVLENFDDVAGDCNAISSGRQHSNSDVIEIQEARFYNTTSGVSVGEVAMVSLSVRFDPSTGLYLGCQIKSLRVGDAGWSIIATSLNF